MHRSCREVNPPIRRAARGSRLSHHHESLGRPHRCPAWATEGALAIVRRPGPAPFDSLVAVTAAAGAWSCLCWLCLAVVVSLLAALPRFAGGLVASASRRIAPAAVRRFVAGALGLVVASGPLASTGIAAAAALPAKPGISAAALTATSAAAKIAPALDRPVALADFDRPVKSDSPFEIEKRMPVKWTPDRPAPPPRPHSGAGTLPLVAATPHARHAIPEQVTVRRGDTLWDIAARSLGAAATPLEVARAWPRWYAANRDVIGPDPALLEPGSLLTPPVPGS